MTSDFAERLKKQKAEKAAQAAKAARANRTRKEIERDAAVEKREHLETLAGDIIKILDTVATEHADADDPHVMVESNGWNANRPSFKVHVQSAGVGSSLSIRMDKKSPSLAIEHQPGVGPGPNMIWGTEQDARLPNQKAIENLIFDFLGDPITQPVISWD